MSFIKELHIASPYNDDDLRLMEEYCEKYENYSISRGESYAQKLKRIRASYQEEEYEIQRELSIINTEIYYTAPAGKITNLIEVRIEKDKKAATIYPKMHTDTKDLIPEICNKIMEQYEIEQVFVFIKKKDQKTIDQLLKKGFLSLLTTEQEEDYIPFLKEKEEEKTRESRRISWS